MWGTVAYLHFVLGKLPGRVLDHGRPGPRWAKTDPPDCRILLWGGLFLLLFASDRRREAPVASLPFLCPTSQAPGGPGQTRRTA